MFRVMNLTYLHQFCFMFCVVLFFVVIIQKNIHRIYADAPGMGLRMVGPQATNQPVNPSRSGRIGSPCCFERHRWVLWRPYIWGRRDIPCPVVS